MKRRRRKTKKLMCMYYFQSSKEYSSHRAPYLCNKWLSFLLKRVMGVSSSLALKVYKNTPLAKGNTIDMHTITMERVEQKMFRPSLKSSYKKY